MITYKHQIVTIAVPQVALSVCIQQRIKGRCVVFLRSMETFDTKHFIKQVNKSAFVEYCVACRLRISHLVTLGICCHVYIDKRVDECAYPALYDCITLPKDVVRDI